MNLKNKTILVTGGAGFIGSHFVKYLLKERDGYNVINVDALSYAADLNRLKEVENDARYSFLKADIRNVKELEKAFSGDIDAVVHFAAETHVDNSIETPSLFADVNVTGTLNLLNLVLSKKIKKYIHISTDEVYGEIAEGAFTEESPFRPNSPYSASKAAADFFVRAYMRTYNLPAIIVRPCNNYGPWQYPEKFIPVASCKLLSGEKIPVYAEGLNRREWLYVEDCAKAIATIMEKGVIGEAYNLGSGVEKKNIDIAEKIVKILGKTTDSIEFVKDRPGHDFRYALNSAKIAQLGWQTRMNFDEGLENTVNWYKNTMINNIPIS
ncbi:MAG: dTDP-glucose 4,6-dehydratase [Dehalococcoidia bacterium]|nr:MAG: dTDP-glucose 4,6-dehydratase [Dehalococcoidia bacterium]